MQIDVDPEKDFHVVINGVAKALSLDVLAEAYQADAIDDETLIWQEGLSDWMRLDTLLAVLGEQDQEQEAAVSSPTPPADPNNYWVMFAPDEVKSVPLEALADAHRLGVVDDETLVQAPGSSEWVPLVVIIAGFVINARRSVAPSQAPTQSMPTEQTMHQSAAYQPQNAPAPAGAVATYSTAPAYSVAPTYNAAPYSSLAPSALNTLAPTAANVGAAFLSVPPSARMPSGLDDLDFPAFKSSRSVWVKRSLIGVGAVAAAFGIYLGTSGSAGEVAARPAAAVAQGVSALPRPEADAPPSDWEKEKALLEEARRKDEVLAKAAKSPTANAFGTSLAGEPKAKQPASAPAKSKSQPKAKKAPVSANAGTGQYDPMNGAL